MVNGAAESGSPYGVSPLSETLYVLENPLVEFF